MEEPVRRCLSEDSAAGVFYLAEGAMKRRMTYLQLVSSLPINVSSLIDRTPVAAFRVERDTCMVMEARNPARRRSLAEWVCGSPAECAEGLLLFMVPEEVAILWREHPFTNSLAEPAGSKLGGMKSTGSSRNYSGVGLQVSKPYATIWQNRETPFLSYSDLRQRVELGAIGDLVVTEHAQFLASDQNVAVE
jgi:hypothetical protein